MFGLAVRIAQQGSDTGYPGAALENNRDAEIAIHRLAWTQKNRGGREAAPV